MLMMLSAALLGAAAAPTHSAQSNQNRSAEKIERALERIAVAQEKPAETPKGNEYERPCKDGEYDNRSDLCAQWYAARAARDAADSAYWAVFWTVASLILSAAGFIALLFTIKQGREANRIAHASYESEIRPIFVLARLIHQKCPEGLAGVA
ncbi:hypothetical protein GS397_00915 [Sphingobium yanoikuyae]|uniref:Uncharacterized protein n=1 Tax=Sphingobium yanoikuyae TaxID=13690 RepID=A0A6P1GDF7_SPHYA|nr:hypothetical protein [Sphingobium yanoikuyae]QHD65771.1 hypothetical protein GS397_00915 [Sphingobium yanoikuyae]